MRILIQEVIQYFHGAIEEVLVYRMSQGNINLEKIEIGNIVNGFLKTLNPPPPFIVVCDEQNNSPENLAQGKLFVEIILDKTDPLVKKILKT